MLEVVILSSYKEIPDSHRKQINGRSLESLALYLSGSLHVGRGVERMGGEVERRGGEGRRGAEGRSGRGPDVLPVGEER